MQATEWKNMAQADIIEKVAPLFTADEKKTGVLTCVSLAQFIQESGYGKSSLSQEANNCFGMKTYLSGNTWAGSTWDGRSVCTKKTIEEYVVGQFTEIISDFRKYACVEDSIADHSAYLLGAKNGSELRYKGLKGEKDYKKAAAIIKNGGYATDSTYVQSLCSIIERWGLEKYNADSEQPVVSKIKIKCPCCGQEIWSDGTKVEEAAPKTIVHCVVRGDTLWGIAEKYYGSGTKYPKIKQDNNLKSDLIIVGQKLLIKL